MGEGFWKDPLRGPRPPLIEKNEDSQGTGGHNEPGVPGFKWEKWFEGIMTEQVGKHS
jgi:hypothetical protein